MDVGDLVKEAFNGIGIIIATDPVLAEEASIGRHFWVYFPKRRCRKWVYINTLAQLNESR